VTAPKDGAVMDLSEGQKHIAGSILVEAGKRGVSRAETLLVVEAFAELLRNRTDDVFKGLAKEAADGIRTIELSERARLLHAIISQPEPKEEPWWKIW